MRVPAVQEPTPNPSRLGGELRYLVVVDCLVAVAFAVPPARDVQPAVTQATAVLEEHLVEVRIADDPLEPVARHLLVGHRQVGSLTQHVLRAPYATHGTVQCLAAVAAGDADWLAIVLAQWLQHFLAQAPHGQHLLIAGLVVDSLSAVILLVNSPKVK